MAVEAAELKTELTGLTPSDLPVKYDTTHHWASITAPAPEKAMQAYSSG